MNYWEIYKFVQKLKRRFCTDDPYEIAEALGIEIEQKPFVDLKGVYVYARKNPYIYLSDSLDEIMERLVLSHELGHHFLHRHLVSGAFQEFGFYDMASKPEKEANIFAANFMISDEDITDNLYYDFTSEQLARHLSVPHELLLIKLNDMNTRGYNFKICYNPRADFLGD